MDTRHDTSFRDSHLTCVDCGQGFMFTAGEARFYASKQLISPPLRCPDCRRRRRATINPDCGSLPRSNWPSRDLYADGDRGRPCQR